MLCLIGGMQVDHAHIIAGHLQHGHLVGDLRPAVATPPALPQELGGENLACGLLYTALDYGKLPPVAQRTNTESDIVQPLEKGKSTKYKEIISNEKYSAQV